jgi:hypothetical protein
LTPTHAREARGATRNGSIGTVTHEREGASNARVCSERAAE